MKFKKGHIPWNTGKKRPPFTEEHRRNLSKAFTGRKLSEETKKKIGLNGFHYGMLGKKWSDERRKNHKSLIGKLGPNWKGDNAGYFAIHKWIETVKGKPQKCEFCGKDGLIGRKIHWANIDHKYKRNLEDYIRLCPKCHRKYDIENNNYKITNKNKKYWGKNLHRNFIGIEISEKYC